MRKSVMPIVGVVAFWALSTSASAGQGTSTWDCRLSFQATGETASMIQTGVQLNGSGFLDCLNGYGETWTIPLDVYLEGPALPPGWYGVPPFMGLQGESSHIEISDDPSTLLGEYQLPDGGESEYGRGYGVIVPIHGLDNGLDIAVLFSSRQGFTGEVNRMILTASDSQGDGGSCQQDPSQGVPSQQDPSQGVPSQQDPSQGGQVQQNPGVAF